MDSQQNNKNTNHSLSSVLLIHYFPDFRMVHSFAHALGTSVQRMFLRENIERTSSLCDK